MLETKAGSGMECAGAGACEGKAAAPCRIVVMVSGGGTNLQAIISTGEVGRTSAAQALQHSHLLVHCYAGGFKALSAPNTRHKQARTEDR